MSARVESQTGAVHWLSGGSGLFSMYRILTVFRGSTKRLLACWRRIVFSLDMNAISQAVSWLSQARQILALGTGRRFHYLFTGDSVPFISVWGYRWSVRMDALMMRMMCSAVNAADVVDCAFAGRLYTGNHRKCGNRPSGMARVLLPLRQHNTAGGTGGSGIAVTGFRKVITSLSPPLPATRC